MLIKNSWWAWGDYYRREKENERIGLVTILRGRFLSFYQNLAGDLVKILWYRYPRLRF